MWRHCRDVTRDIKRDVVDVKIYAQSNVKIYKKVHVLEHWSFFLFHIFWVGQFNRAISNLVRVTRDLELQGHAPYNMTFAISGSTCARALIFFFFSTYFGLGNSIRLSVTLSEWRVTLNFKVTHPITWPLLSLEVHVLEHWSFFSFPHILGWAIQ